MVLVSFLGPDDVLGRTNERVDTPLGLRQISALKINTRSGESFNVHL